MFKKQPKTERAWWRYARTNTRVARKRRVIADRRFQELFPEGAENLRNMIKVWAHGIRRGLLTRNCYEKKFEDLFNIHPDALAIISKYGTDAVGFKWKQRPTLPEPMSGSCFGNAYTWANVVKEKYPFFYVEGVALSVWTTPTHHAWNAYPDHTGWAMDWSWYAISHWTRYRGIPLSLEEYRELAALTPIGDCIGLLFRKKNFTPAAKKRLLQILKAREKNKTGRP